MKCYLFSAHELYRTFSQVCLSKLLNHKHVIIIMNEDFNVNPICVTPWDGRYKGVGFNMLFLLKKIREVQRCQEKSPQRSSEFRRAQKGWSSNCCSVFRCAQKHLLHSRKHWFCYRTAESQSDLGW